jgi:cell division protein FtsB
MFRAINLKKIQRKIQIFGVLILLLWLSWQVATPAQTTTQLESRLSRIEFENTTLRAAINQLEAQVARLSSDAGIAYTPREPARSPAAPSALADDPTFKRLATLVIELKERVVAVEQQVAASPASR